MPANDCYRCGGRGWVDCDTCRAAARWILSSRAHLRVDIPKEREAELRALVGEWGGVVA